jgi:hypothetical protein
MAIGTYRAVADNGPVFLSFQWEQLLLEVAFVSVLLAPWFGRGPSRLRSCAAMWLLRFMLCKLMLMSGVVKLQANCPTWTQLTATEYHFATQPLPTAAAQVARFMPTLLHRASVAGTLLLEIPAALLLLVPLRHTIAIAGTLQVVLQVLILSTGNYTFFNALSLAVAAACAAPLHTVDDLPHMQWLDSAAARSVQQAGIAAFLWLSFLFMFQVGWVPLQGGGSPTGRCLTVSSKVLCKPCWSSG